MTRPTKAIRIAIVDDNEGTRTTLERLLGITPEFQVAGTTGDGLAAVDLIGDLQPDVALIDVHLPSLDGIKVTEEVRKRSPGTAVVVMSVEDQYQYLRPAMIAGASDFLTKPFTGEELMQSIRRAFERAATLPKPVTNGAGPQARSTPGKVIAVYSPKGGVGRTTIAANAAVAIRSEFGKSVMLMDANFVFGDVGVMLNLPPTRTIIDLLPHCSEIDGHVLSQSLVEHASGVKALLAPPRPEMAELVHAEHLRAIIEQARRTFDFVIVDTPASFHEVNLTVLDVADQILVVSTLELPTLKNVKMFFETAHALGYPNEKTMLVVNRADSAAGIRVEDLPDRVKKPVAVAISNDWRLATSATNEGVPFVLSARESLITRDLLELTQILTGEEQLATERADKRGLKFLKFAFR